MKVFNYSHSNTITPLLLIQVGIVVAGSLSVKMVMKTMGYNTPESQSLVWNDSCYFVRNWGFIFLLIPIAFLYLLYRGVKKENNEIISSKIIFSCLIVTLFMLYFFVRAFLAAAQPLTLSY